jgi:hypothetical protein
LKRILHRLSALIVFLCLNAFPLPIGATGGDIAVVVRPDTPVENLSLADIRRLMLGERQFWNSNLRVTLLIASPPAREREVVLKIIYRMSEREFKQYWISKVLRAEANSQPMVVFSTGMAVELMNSLPGAVAFVDATEVPKGLKVLRIDGKLPGDRTYPLR